MATEFDEQLKKRLLAFQQHHGLSGNGRVEADTWSKLVAGAYGGSGDPQAAQAVIGQVAGGSAHNPAGAESMTNEQIVEEWRKSTSLDDFKLRLQLGPVTDVRLFEFDTPPLLRRGARHQPARQGHPLRRAPPKPASRPAPPRLPRKPVPQACWCPWQEPMRIKSGVDGGPSK